MKTIIHLLFEAKMLKELNRSGYAFLGSGKESVAEHSFMTAFICYVMSQTETDINGEKLISMALLHDLAEARTGDFNYVQKQYSRVNETLAVSDLIKGLPFGNNIEDLIQEFNDGVSKEALLVKDADQISFILELKQLMDTGARGPEKWLPVVIERIQTPTGKKLAGTIMDTNWDDWWLNNYSE
ncbi:MAG: HD domain-containing protein [Desulfobacteraceae bacterium]|nr:MAG: HD domain-containing protein [Desulfobacteraceae bacterium]